MKSCKDCIYHYIETFEEINGIGTKEHMCEGGRKARYIDNIYLDCLLCKFFEKKIEKVIVRDVVLYDFIRFCEDNGVIDRRLPVLVEGYLEHKRNKLMSKED